MMIELFTIPLLINIKNPEPLPQPKQIETIQVEPKQETKTIKKKAKPEVYRVVKGDSLNKIAKKKKTTVKRLWSFNKQIKHQDKLKVGQALKIPSKSLKIKNREYVQVVAKRAKQTIKRASVGESAGASTPTNSPTSYRGFSWGWCTYFAQLSRPDKSFRGDAKDWIVFANSSVPAIGAVAVDTSGGYGHVGVVTDLRPGEVKVIHMNYRSFGVISEDWTSASRWNGYIY